MNHPGADIVARLSLSALHGLEELAAFPAPAGAIAHGVSGEPSLGAIAARAEELWRFTLLDAQPGSGGVARWSTDPGVYLVEVSAGLRVAGSSTPAGPELLLLDARDQPAWVRVSGETDDFVWRLERERATCARVVVEEPLPLVDVAPVQLEMFVEEERPAPWLAERFGELARGDALSRIMAVGLVARSWVAEKPDPGEIGRILAGSHPSPRALAWMRRLERKQIHGTEKHAMARSRAVGGRLFALVEAIAEDPPAATALAWLHDRDDLQGVLHLLRAVDAGAALSRALDHLDRAALAHATAFGLVHARGDPRLCAVAAAEPDLWWGALAL